MVGRPSPERIIVFILAIVCIFIAFYFQFKTNNIILSTALATLGVLLALVQATSQFQHIAEAIFRWLESMVRSFGQGVRRLWSKFVSGKKGFSVLIICLLIISLVCNGIQWFFSPHIIYVPTPAPDCNDTSICIVPKLVKDSVMYIGINDGSNRLHYFNQFDPEPDANCTNGTEAQTTEAQLECDIYKANRAIGKSYITLLIVTTLSRTVSDPNASLTGGINDLRGAYIAQKYYNQNINHTTKLRLLIANMGTRSAAVETAPDLVKQIEQLPTLDKTFAGIVGLPFSKSALVALNSFKKHDIPIVSPSASSDDLSMFSNFYRIIRSDSEQSQIIRTFITSRLLANDPQKKCIAVFHDDSDAYSKTLGNGLLTSGISFSRTETYEEGKPESLVPGVNEVLKYGCGMIFFAGFPDDLNSLKDMLRERTKLPSSQQNILIVGGGALYNLGGYTGDNYKNLFFTTNATYAYPNPSAEDSNFLQEYHESFDPQNQYEGQYGAGLPGVQAILSFDAVQTFLHALAKASNNASPSLKEMSDALPKVEFNGVSGYINLVHRLPSSPNSNPINKYVYMACTDSDGHTQIISTYQFVSGQPAEVGTFHSDALDKCRKQDNVVPVN